MKTERLLQRYAAGERDFTGANLLGANLYRADLREADLRYANLRGADLTGVDLHGAVGVVHPPVNDPRGHRCVAIARPDGWRIASGCRWFTLDEAEAHWGDQYEGDRDIGDAYLAAVAWLRRNATEKKVSERG